jgi:hypothetical protein
VALFTCLLVIVGGLQTCAFVQSERASLGVSAIGLTTQTLVPDQPITIRIGMRNGGRSTAEIVDANVMLNIGRTVPQKAG